MLVNISTQYFHLEIIRNFYIKLCYSSIILGIKDNIIWFMIVYKGFSFIQCMMLTLLLTLTWPGVHET